LPTLVSVPVTKNPSTPSSAFRPHVTAETV
jgi:hypothetical protein